jgi:hypothetical protein
MTLKGLIADLDTLVTAFRTGDGHASAMVGLIKAVNSHFSWDQTGGILSERALVPKSEYSSVWLTTSYS